MSADLLADYALVDRPRRSDTFIVEGRWAVEALLASEFDIRSIVVAEGQHLDLDTQRAAVHRLPKAEIASLAGFAFHRGVLACALRPEPQSIPHSFERGFVVVCPEIADESNLGAIVRNAAGFGAAGVAVPAGRGADIFSRKAIRASSGTVFRVPIFESPNLLDDVCELRSRNFTVVGSTISDKAVSLGDSPALADFVLLLGGEGEGLSQTWIDVCDLEVTIPMANGIDSLNVACSSAILLYALTGR